MGGGGVLQYPHDLAFRQDFTVIDRQKQGFANGKRRQSGNVRQLCGGGWHWVSTFFCFSVKLHAKLAENRPSGLICISIRP